MISLYPMSAGEFDAFALRSTGDYALEKASAGEVAAQDAMDLARAEFQRLLPAGLHTPGHHFFVLRNHADGLSVGALWAQERQRGSTLTMHVLDIHVVPEQRRRGFARAALQALEQHAQALGASEITLHVFGHNLAAQALYAGMGFRVTDVSMAKALSPGREEDRHVS